MAKGQIIVQTEVVRALGERVLFGALSGGQQIALEKADQARNVSDVSITALQNVIPLLETVAASGIALFVKSDRVRSIASTFVATESTMLTYRMLKVALPVVQGMIRKHGKGVDYGLGGGHGHGSSPSGSGTFNPNYGP